jgi:nucleotide-binding universal stress UspA family protein
VRGGLLRTATEDRADLIVVGGHRGGWSAARTLAERIVQHSPCPVALVPQRWEGDATTLRRIGVVADCGPGRTRALDVAADLAAASGAAVQLVDAIPVGASIELARRRDSALLDPVYAQAHERLAATLERVDLDVPISGEVRVSTPPLLAEGVAKEFDIVVLAARRRPRTLARRLVRHARGPVILVRPD